MRQGRITGGGGSGRSGAGGSNSNVSTSTNNGNNNGNNNNNNGGGDDSFVKRISEMFMKWKVRPDVVLRGRHENKSKGALSAFWQARQSKPGDVPRRAGVPPLALPLLQPLPPPPLHPSQLCCVVLCCAV